MALFGLAGSRPPSGWNRAQLDKVVELVRGKGGYALKSHAIVSLPAMPSSGSIEAGVVTDAIRNASARRGSPPLPPSSPSRAATRSWKRVPLPR